MQELLGQHAPSHVEPSATAGMEQFEEKKYNVTNLIESACGLLFSCGIVGWTRKTLLLEADEAVLITRNNCLNRTSRRPYAQLGHVDAIQSCCCCWAVGSDLVQGEEGSAGISPSCGCNEALVTELVAELQKRKVGRGNIAQIKAQEVLAMRVDHLHSKMDAIIAHLSIATPPPPAMGVPQPASMVRAEEAGASSSK